MEKKVAIKNKGRRLWGAFPTKPLGFGTKSISLDEGGEEVHANDLGWTLEEWVVLSSL